MVSGMIRPVVVVVMRPEPRSGRIAQHDLETAVDRRQHEPRRHERAQAEHRKHKGCGPMPIQA